MNWDDIDSEPDSPVSSPVPQRKSLALSVKNAQQRSSSPTPNAPSSPTVKKMQGAVLRVLTNFDRMKACQTAILNNEIHTMKRVLDMDPPLKLNMILDSELPLLHWAGSVGNIAAIELLLEKGADPSFEDSDRRNAFHLALMKGKAEAAKLMFNKRPKGVKPIMLLEVRGPEDWTALHNACAGGSAELVQFCVENNARLDKIDKQGRTALHIAAASGLTECVAVLLDAGAQYDQKCSEGKTPLLAAAIEGHDEIVGLLAKAGADVNVKGSDGDPPIVWAYLLDHWPVMEVLMRHGADASGEDPDSGQTYQELLEEWQREQAPQDGDDTLGDDYSGEVRRSTELISRHLIDSIIISEFVHTLRTDGPTDDEGEEERVRAENIRKSAKTPRSYLQEQIQRPHIDGPDFHDLPIPRDATAEEVAWLAEHSKNILTPYAGSRQMSFSDGVNQDYTQLDDALRERLRSLV